MVYTQMEAISNECIQNVVQFLSVEQGTWLVLVVNNNCDTGLKYLYSVFSVIFIVQ